MLVMGTPTSVFYGACLIQQWTFKGYDDNDKLIKKKIFRLNTKRPINAYIDTRNQSFVSMYIIWSVYLVISHATSSMRCFVLISLWYLFSVRIYRKTTSTYKYAQKYISIIQMKLFCYLEAVANNRKKSLPDGSFPKMLAALLRWKAIAKFYKKKHPCNKKLTRILIVMVLTAFCWLTKCK